jgi:hypothetical protein
MPVPGVVARSDGARLGSPMNVPREGRRRAGSPQSSPDGPGWSLPVYPPGTRGKSRNKVSRAS